MTFTEIYDRTIADVELTGGKPLRVVARVRRVDSRGQTGRPLPSELFVHVNVYGVTARRTAYSARFLATDEMDALAAGCFEAGDVRPLLDYLFDRCYDHETLTAIEKAIKADEFYRAGTPAA